MRFSLKGFTTAKPGLFHNMAHNTLKKFIFLFSVNALEMSEKSKQKPKLVEFFSFFVSCQIYMEAKRKTKIRQRNANFLSLEDCNNDMSASHLKYCKKQKYLNKSVFCTELNKHKPCVRVFVRSHK